MKRVFSGIQPTGHLTLGNYLGAIQNWVKMQNQNDYECLYCLVDLHAITLPKDPNELRENVLTNVAAYMACGLDPKKSIIFNQSKVPQHTELGWILGCITPMGWLNRMTQFKDKSGNDKEKACLGLYAYPVLQAADILIYHATHVPIGEDQIQHLELARDIAGAFNRRYGIEYFKLPEIYTSKATTRIMSLQDGTKKMSKSDPSDLSRINLTDDRDLIAKKIKKAKTDAIVGITYDPENRPEIANLINIYAALAEQSIESVAEEFSSFNNAQLKDRVTQILVDKITPIGQKIVELKQDKAHLLTVLTEGGEKAHTIADQTIIKIRELIGFI